MFQKLFVPLDGSARAERAVHIAARIAQATGGTVVLLHVVHLLVEYAPSLVQAPALTEQLCMKHWSTPTPTSPGWHTHLSHNPHNEAPTASQRDHSENIEQTSGQLL
jgi:nucleotide-binding universal stress UspA family protein